MIREHRQSAPRGTGATTTQPCCLPHLLPSVRLRGLPSALPYPSRQGDNRANTPCACVVQQAERASHGAAIAEIILNRSSDRQLVDRILAGHEEAVAELVDAHHGAIYRFLCRMCRNAHWAEDLTQETFAAAWSRLDSFNGTASLATWLHRIAYCKFIDAHRRRQRSAPIDPGMSIDSLSGAGPGPEEATLACEESERIHAALARVDATDREVIVLHYFQGFSFREMAAVLNIQIGLAKWRTSQALTKLRKLLGEP